MSRRCFDRVCLEPRRAQRGVRWRVQRRVVVRARADRVVGERLAVARAGAAVAAVAPCRSPASLSARGTAADAVATAAAEPSATLACAVDACWMEIWTCT